MKSTFLTIAICISTTLIAQTASWQLSNIDYKERNSTLIGQHKISIVTHSEKVGYKTNSTTYFCNYDKKLKKWDSTKIKIHCRMVEGVGNVEEFSQMLTCKNAVALVTETNKYRENQTEWKYGIALSYDGEEWYGRQYTYYGKEKPMMVMVDKKTILLYDFFNDTARDIIKLTLDIPAIKGYTNMMHINESKIRSAYPIGKMLFSNTNKAYLFYENNYYVSKNNGTTWTKFGNEISVKTPYIDKVMEYGDTIMYILETKDENELKYYYSLNGGTNIKELNFKRAKRAKPYLTKIANKYLLFLNDTATHFIEIKFKNGAPVLNERAISNTGPFSEWDYNNIEWYMNTFENKIWGQKPSTDIYYKLDF